MNKLEYQYAGKKYSLSSAPEWTIEHIKARNEIMGEELTELLSFNRELEAEGVSHILDYPAVATDKTHNPPI